MLVPPPEDRAVIHQIIYEELCLGQILPESRRAYQAIMERLAEAGAEAIILGCTEISLLVQQEHSNVPLFDTTALHAQAAAHYAIES